MQKMGEIKFSYDIILTLLVFSILFFETIVMIDVYHQVKLFLKGRSRRFLMQPSDCGSWRIILNNSHHRLSRVFKLLSLRLSLNVWCLIFRQLKCWLCAHWNQRIWRLDCWQQWRRSRTPAFRTLRYIFQYFKIYLCRAAILNTDFFWINQIESLAVIWNILCSISNGCGASNWLQLWTSIWNGKALYYMKAQRNSAWRNRTKNSTFTGSFEVDYISVKNLIDYKKKVI